MTVEELKNALINFNNIFKWLEVNSLNYIAVIVNLEDVHAIRYDREVIGSRMINKDPIKLELYDKKDKLDAKRKYYEDMIDEVNLFFNWLDKPCREIAIDKYVNELSYKELAEKYNYNSSTIWRMLENRIDEYVNEKS